MSGKIKKKLKKSADSQAKREADEKKVFMRFPSSQTYNDLDNPIFAGGKIYALQGAPWIERWLKRGGEIVTEKVAKEDPSYDPKAPVSTSPESSTLLEKAEKAAMAYEEHDLKKAEEANEEEDEEEEEEHETHHAGENEIGGAGEQREKLL